MNLKGIAIYLGLNYLLVSLLSFVFLSEGLLVFQAPNVFQYLLQAAMMGIPALCALAAAHFSPDARDAYRPLWPVPIRPAFRITVMAPLVFLAAYAIATAAGFTFPQWNLAGLMNRVSGQLSTPLPPDVASAAPWLALVAYPVLSVIVGATLFAFIALGSEIGWRGYLLPRLLPLGAIPAYLIGGLCWGLWFFPFIFGWYRETGAGGSMGETLLRTIALAIVLSAVLGQIAQRTRHLTLAALCLGAFAGQANGIWIHLFQQATPPWTGAAGWISIGVWAAVALLPRLMTKPVAEKQTQSQPGTAAAA